MTTYSKLNYTTPARNQGQIVETSYAVTQDEIVRRTIDRSESNCLASASFETADLCELSGPFEPWNRVPSVTESAWETVSGDDETPA